MMLLWIEVQKFCQILKALDGRNSMLGVLISVASAVDKDGLYVGSVDQIAARANCSRATAYRAMKQLEEKGYIHKIQKSVWRFDPKKLKEFIESKPMRHIDVSR